MDSRVVTVVLRKLGAKLDRLDRLVNDLHEQMVVVDVKLDALLLGDDSGGESESGESESGGSDESESIGPESTASEEMDDSDMSFIVDDHTSSSEEESEPVPPGYESEPS